MPTDNGSLGKKMALRRHFLARYHQGAQGLRVFDACQGDGVLWSMLLPELDTPRYWGVDVKRRPGRLTINSVRVLNQRGWVFDVIDIDTYGEPWTHWLALLANAQTQPLTVFLTLGHLPISPASNVVMDALGFGEMAPRVPNTIKARLLEKALDHCLAMSYIHGYAVRECRRTSHGSAIYLGIRLEPA